MLHEIQNMFQKAYFMAIPVTYLIFFIFRKIIRIFQVLYFYQGCQTLGTQNVQNPLKTK